MTFDNISTNAHSLTAEWHIASLIPPTLCALLLCLLLCRRLQLILCPIVPSLVAVRRGIAALRGRLILSRSLIIIVIVCSVVPIATSRHIHPLQKHPIALAAGQLPHGHRFEDAIRVEAHCDGHDREHKEQNNHCCIKGITVFGDLVPETLGETICLNEETHCRKVLHRVLQHEQNVYDHHAEVHGISSAHENQGHQYLTEPQRRDSDAKHDRHDEVSD